MSSGLRSRFVELCEYLKSTSGLLGFKTEQFESEVEKLRVENGGINETVDGWHFANFSYRGVIYIERVPLAKFALLALLVRAWLNDNDDLRDNYKLADPEIETITLDKKYLDVIINIDFVDEIYITEVENGAIPWNGKTFDIAEHPVDYAESGEVNNAAT